VHNYLNDYILSLKQCDGWKDQGLTVFIDTNPALTMYTRLALCAARKLVMVVMADDFSREALRYVS
jgi:cellulose biosynthesis protein BcsQ